MYSLDGEITYTSNTYSTGNGVSIGGAIIGDLIAGAPGMIIGATKDRGNVRTDIEQHDSREICLYYSKSGNTAMIRITPYPENSDFMFEDFLREKFPYLDAQYMTANQQLAEKRREESRRKRHESRGSFMADESDEERTNRWDDDWDV